MDLPKPVRTVIALDPRTRQRGLMVEIHPEIQGNPGEPELSGFEGRLFEAGIRIGLFVTRSTTVIVRDLLSSMSFASNHFERDSIETDKLLVAAQIGPPRGAEKLYERFRNWLEIVPENWMSLLADEAVAVMIPDVIGHLAQADFEAFEGVLDGTKASA